MSLILPCRAEFLEKQLLGVRMSDVIREWVKRSRSPPPLPPQVLISELASC